jgi:hypothetical protein
MNEHVDVMCQVRESFSGLRMDTPVAEVFARSRARRRRRRAGLAAAAAATAGAAAAVTLTLGGPVPAHSGNSPRPSPDSATLAAFSVTRGPGDSTSLILRKGQSLDASALRQALAEQGIPALVTVGTFCRSTPAPAGGVSQILSPTMLANGSEAVEIDGQAMPAGTRLSVGYFLNSVRLGLIEDGAPLSCASTSRQPAVRVLPSGSVHG